MNPKSHNAMFNACVKRSFLPYGQVEIRCKLGLWSVSGREHKEVKIEAKHYWIQYYEDGEYNKFLGVL